MIPKPSDNLLPIDFEKGLYDPRFLPRNINLNEILGREVIVEKETKKKVDNRLANSNSIVPVIGKDGIPTPLTKEEAEEVEKRVNNMLGKIAATKARISDLVNFIDESAKIDGKELSFKVDIKKRPSLRRVIKKVYGIKTDTITYSMYKEALAVRRRIEKQETDSYITQSFDDEEEED